MTGNRKSRREFLKNSAQLASLSLLPSLFTFESEASGTEVPVRLIVIQSKNGQRQEYWTPHQQAVTSFAHGRELSLSNFALTGISPILGTAFTPYLSKMNVVMGLDIVNAMGHNSQALLGHFTSSNPIPTIDYVLSKSPQFYGTKTPILRSLNYGESFSYGFSGTQFTRLPTFNSVGGSFERIFGMGDAAALTRQSNIVERTLGLYRSLEKSASLPAADRRLIETQASLVSDLRNRLSSTEPLACTIPTKPTDAGNEASITASIDMIVASFLCDATRIACVGIENPDPISTPNDWHGASHNPEIRLNSATNSLTINKWIAEKFVLRLIQKLDSVQEANGKSMLDNSLIYWGNELSGGNGHSAENMPVLLAGSAGGRINSGYLYDYRQEGLEVDIDNAGSKSRIGRPYNQLLVTILQAMGLSPADYESNGIVGYGVNKSANAARNNRYTSMFADVGKPLLKLYRAG